MQPKYSLFWERKTEDKSACAMLGNTEAIFKDYFSNLLLAEVVQEGRSDPNYLLLCLKFSCNLWKKASENLKNYKHLMRIKNFCCVINTK